MIEEQKLSEYNPEEIKKNDFDSILSELNALKQIEKDFSSLVEGQNDDLKTTLEIQDKAITESREAGKSFQEAALVQNKGWKIRLAARLTALGAGIGLIAGPIGIAFGGAIGGFSGAVLGKKIEKFHKSEIRKVDFD